MRLTFYALLLCNLGLFAWQYLGDSGPEFPQAGEAGNASVQLLSERASPVSDALVPCQDIGPIADILVAQELVTGLSEAGVDASLQEMAMPTGEYDYRVLLPPLPSLQEAFRRLREFKSRGIESYVITQGEDAQGISLGVFSTLDRAETLRGRLQESGYDVQIRGIPRLVHGYRVRVDKGALPKSLISSLSGKFSQISAISCVDDY